MMYVVSMFEIHEYFSDILAMPLWHDIALVKGNELIELVETKYVH